MRFLVVALFCLAGGLASAKAQSIAEQINASATPAVVQPANLDAVKPVEPQAEKSVERPANKLDEQHAAKPVELPAELTAKPDEKAAKPAEPVAKLAEQAAQTCPGNPDALGTSRVITITPGEFSRVGTMQYRQTLPLKDHEVVLTFDDGPIPPYSNEILEILASQCVKANYFMVGEMARNYPSIVRRVYNAGHTIGTHSQNHPRGFQHLSMQRVEQQVDGGIASVDAALGDPKALAPFFRIPGLGRTNAIDEFLEHKGLVTWSIDVDTNDWWRGSSAGTIVQRAMRRLNEKGRGIILMHDIHPATVLALPRLLKELKAGGYRVVQVVPAGERPEHLPDLVASPAEEKGNWPRVLRAGPGKSSPAITSLRHRVKKIVSGKHRRLKTARLPEKERAISAHDWKSSHY